MAPPSSQDEALSRYSASGVTITKCIGLHANEKYQFIVLAQEIWGIFYSLNYATLTTISEVDI